MKTTEVDAITGTTVERDLTEAEILQRQKDEAMWRAEIEAQEAKEAARLSGLAKLEALGLTQAEAQAIAGI